MRKLSLLLPMIFVIVTLNSCEEESPQAFSEGLQIIVGRQCGWCYGEQKLTISSEVSSYYYDYACADSLDIPERFFKTPTKDWKQLNEYLAAGDFGSINLNSCAVCADGCDYIIKITDIDFEHEIRFVSSDAIEDTSIQNMAVELITQLEALYDQK